MSLEQAITDHAAAIRELAAAMITTAASGLNLTVEQRNKFYAEAASVGMSAKATTLGKTEPTDAQIDAEIDAAVTQVEADAKPNATRAVIEQKLAEARAAKNAGSAAGTATAAADTQTTAGAADTATAEAQTSYDYAKDVAPVLTKVAQKSRDSLVALLAKFGAKKGNELKAEDYWAVLADANKLLGG